MAIGFGPHMPDTPMVVMWPNNDGTVSLSQRIATDYSMPTVVSSPQRVATLQSALSTTAKDGSKDGKYVFTIPWDGVAQSRYIWAFGRDRPASEADADFNQHRDAGYAVFDLTKSLTASEEITETTPAALPPAPTAVKATSASTKTYPLTASQRMAYAHALFCTIGFLVLLPAGALVSRWLRTFGPAWYTAHWVLQFAAAGPAILVGLAFGALSIENSRHPSNHLNDKHKKWGIALLALYLFQCMLGAFIHWVKPKNTTRRPFQNYLHATFGLILIALGFYQVRTGYRTEWFAVSNGEIFDGANILWYTWLVLLPVFYFGGLVMLPKQLRQEMVAPISMEKPVSDGEQSSLLAESQDVEEIGMIPPGYKD
ncbi:hypothetical protein BDP27DRAFT_1334319 [Rhodocollybia butyracea]|uniref:Cytochrome b561 domain-containing protein n=1 Tax=Rhodocollybia butyracea TaxID=206335 RepID=A0A9P5PL53_9AGAR|nr:hypothetical protein BDP27DRAFT_1334319 [Rhodocollybia butyracea]